MKLFKKNENSQTKTTQKLPMGRKARKAFAVYAALVCCIDPEREYSPLVKAMQGEVIHISATSENHINAMDMNSDYAGGGGELQQKVPP